jgi:hypothetical protein
MRDVAIDSFDFTPDEVRARLHALFEAAKARDEFEFGCTLLRVRGMESAGWDPFVETSRLVEDLLTLSSAPLVGHTKVRLGLLLYSHLTEVGAIYDVLANLTRVIAGERYVTDPFLDLARNRKGEVQFLSTPGTVRGLKGMLEDVGHGGLVEVIDWFFYSPVRNAFAHADYTLHEDKFRSSDWFEVGGIRTRELPLVTVADLFNRALGFYGVFMDEYEGQRRGYTANKVVLGRFTGGPDPEPIELLADAEHGLYGFHSPPGSEHNG